MATTADSTTPWVVYILVDPRSEQPRYVGWTVNARTRLRDHTKASQLAKGTRRDRWIAGLIECGLKPVMTVVEHGVGPGWADAERRWIAHFRTAGADLTNHTDGGEGTPGRLHTDDAKARMSAKRKGVKPHPNAIAATVALRKGQKDSLEKIEARMSAVRGVPKSAEHRAKLAEANRGKIASAETRAKMKAARALQPPMTQEQRDAVSQRFTGTKNPGASEAKRAWWASKTPEERSEIARKNAAKRSPECRRAVSALMHDGLTPEIRSAAAKKAWANRSPEQKAAMQSNAGKSAWAKLTKEQRSEAMRLRWLTRRKKKISERQ